MPEHRAGVAAAEWRRGWSVVATGLGGMMLSTAHNYSLGVVMGPLQREFGWTRAEITAGPIIMAAVALPMAPLVGAAVDRFGPRRIATCGVVAYTGALAALSLAGPTILSWWLGWLLLSFGAMMVLATVWTKAIGNAFVRHRGLALAIALAGTGLGAAVYPLMTSALLDAFGWRGAYRLLALFGLALVLPLALATLPGARDVAATPIALRPSAGRIGLVPRRFPRLAAAAVFVAFVSGALTVNGVPMLIGNGFGQSAAAATVGVVGVGAVIGRLSGGVLLDRFNANAVAAIMVLSPIATALLLLEQPQSQPAATLAFFILGLALGTEFDACAYLCTRHFGLARFGFLFGAINGILLAGNAVAPFAANLAFDLTGTYRGVLWAMIPFCLTSSALFATLGPYARET